LSQVPSRFAGRKKFFEGGGRAIEKALPCLRQTDTARRSKQKRNSNPRLKGAHGLADGRRSDSEFVSSLPEAAPPGGDKECFDPFKRPAPYCVAPLHSL